MKNLCIALALLLCSLGTMAQTRKLFGVNDGVFSINTDGTQANAGPSLQSSFEEEDLTYTTLLSGSGPDGPTVYGIAQLAGAHGAIYQAYYDGNQILTPVFLHYFSGHDGSRPAGRLTQLFGKLWGVTAKGGNHDKGVVFTMLTDGTGFTVIHHFNGTNGASPQSGLRLVFMQEDETEPELWGTTRDGGLNNKGAVYSLDLNGAFTLEYSFDDGDGTKPYAEMEERAGKLWGTTTEGGSLDFGTIFNIDYRDEVVLSVAHSFNGTDGAMPIGRLKHASIDSEDWMVGLASQGGSDNKGTVYKIRLDESDFELLLEFDDTDGSTPTGGLSLDFTSQLFLGTLKSSTGTGGKGILFGLDLNHVHGPTTFIELHEFDGSLGSMPLGDVNQSNNGLIGAGLYGGSQNAGTIFQFNDGTTKRANLPAWPSEPVGGLTLLEGKLYGVTKSGGANNLGTIYRTNTDGSGVQVMYNFSTLDGGTPLDGITVYDDKLWGTNSAGGDNGNGRIYWAFPSGAFMAEIHNFTLAADGGNPNSLVESNSLLWGTTAIGGANDAGTLFSFDYSQFSFSVAHTFTVAQGTDHKGRLLPYDGSLWGVAAGGGANGVGTIYKVDQDDFSYTKIKDLATADGTNPVGGLVEIDGLLVGTTASGGTNGMGTVYTIDPSDDSFTRTINLDATTGGSPKGPLTESEDLLYGVTTTGGAHGFGTFFSLTPDGETLTVLHNFTPESGGGPTNTTLIEVNQAPTVSGDIEIVFAEDNDVEIDLADYFDDVEDTGGGLTYVLDNSPPGFISEISIDGTIMTVVLAENQFGNFTMEITATDSDGAVVYGSLPLHIKPVVDDPIVSNGTTTYLTLSQFGPYVSRSNLDGSEVTHVKVTGINNGTLYDSDENEISEGEFVSLDNLNQGFRFLPTVLGDITFYVQLATGNSDGDLGGAVVPVTVTVDKASPVITWPTPPQIYIGNPLTEVHLNASAEIDGTFTYNYELGTVLGVGAFQYIFGTFDPDDTEHYNSVDFSQRVTVYGESRLLGVGTPNIFSYTRGASAFETIASTASPSSNGLAPNGELLKVGDKVYGTMQSGGENGHGTIYYMNANGTGFTKIHDFDGTNGSKPVRGLTYDASLELLVGVTAEGGTDNHGVIFSIEIAGENFVKRHDFAEAEGWSPDAPLTSYNGKMFGSTTTGGDGHGVVFSIDLNDNSYIVIHNFSEDEGSAPRGAFANHGSLFGVTEHGGDYGHGTIYEFNDNGYFAVFHSFDGEEGANPLSGLIIVSGELWGTTSNGGGDDHDGVLFRFNFNNGEGFDVVHKFPESGITSPTGKLALIDGRLWGTTSSGGANSLGGLFTVLTTGPDFDFQELASFSSSDGGGHINGGMVFVGTTPRAAEGKVFSFYEDEGENLSVYLGAVFHDSEDDATVMTYSIDSNSNPELVDASVDTYLLTFTAPQNESGNAELEVTATDLTGATVSGVFGIEILPKGDIPSVTEASAFVGQFNEDGLVVTKNELDGEECTHFYVNSINGGELFYHDEITPISAGDFVPYSEGALGLKFKPAPNETAYILFKGAVVPDEFQTISSDFVFLFISVSKQTPIITWEPQPLTYGTPIGEGQLNAIANVPGTFEYTSAIGDELFPGSNLVIAYFTPDDEDLYNSTSEFGYIEVSKRTPIITWQAPANITYPTPLSELQLNATVDVESGVQLTYTYGDGHLLPPGTHEMTVSAVYFNSNYYNEPAPVTVMLTVEGLSGDITWPTPVPITYGTPLSLEQLNATADIEGEFIYWNSNGDILNAGQHTLHVQFIPYDGDYISTSADVILTVEQALPEVSWLTPAEISYGTPLGDQHLNAESDIGGTFEYTPAIGTILDVGTHTLTADFVSDDENYKDVTGTTVAITVGKGNPGITWPAITIPVGTMLSAVHFNATADIDGTFTYHESAGAAYSGGTYTLTASFVPTDASRYNSKTVTTTLVVQKTNPVITWSAPNGIDYGTPLSNTQLNATSDVAGTFTYTPAIGLIPDAGSRVLTALFSPVNTANYNAVTVTATLQVAKANQTVTSFAPPPANLKFGDQPIDLSAVASSGLAVVFASSNENVIRVNGTVATIIGAGTAALTASQPGNTNYNAAAVSLEQPVTVVKGNQVITFQSVDDKTLGDAAFLLTTSSTSSQAIGLATSSDKITLTGSLVTMVKAGRATVTASQPATANYFAAAVDRSFCIKPAKPVITSNNSNPDAPVLTSSSSSGNQWFLNGTAITGATTQTHTVVAGGEYTVQVSADDCTSLPSAAVRFLVTAAMLEASAPVMSIHPNPASDEIHIVWKSADTGDRTILLYDMLGREVERRPMDTEELTIGITNLGGGAYLILGVQGAKRFQQRFVKE